MSARSLLCEGSACRSPRTLPWPLPHLAAVPRRSWREECGWFGLASPSGSRCVSSAPLTPACSSPAAPSAQGQDPHTHSLQGRFLARAREGCGQVRGVVTQGVWSRKGCGQVRGVVKRGVWSSEGCGQVRDVSETHLASSPPTPHLPQSRRSRQRRRRSCVSSWPSLICSIRTELSAPPPAHSGRPSMGSTPPPPPHSGCTPQWAHPPPPKRWMHPHGPPL